LGNNYCRTCNCGDDLNTIQKCLVDFRTEVGDRIRQLDGDIRGFLDDVRNSTIHCQLDKLIKSR